MYRYGSVAVSNHNIPIVIQCFPSVNLSNMGTGAASYINEKKEIKQKNKIKKKHKINKVHIKSLYIVISNEAPFISKMNIFIYSFS